MQVFIENETKEIFHFRGYKKLITAVTETCGRRFRIPEAFEVNVMIVFPETIRQINRRTRNIDKVTDVLSFPYFDFTHPGDTADLISAGQETILGDIVICAQKVISQAEEYGHSQKRELAFLVVHSMLHLTGFDHMTKADEAVMMKEADSLMQELGIDR